MAKKSAAGNVAGAVKKAARAVGDAADKYVVRPVKKAVGVKAGGRKKSTGKKSAATKSTAKKGGRKK